MKKPKERKIGIRNRNVSYIGNASNRKVSSKLSMSFVHIAASQIVKEKDCAIEFLFLNKFPTVKQFGIKFNMHFV